MLLLGPGTPIPGPFLFWESERSFYSHLSPFPDVNWRWVMSAEAASAKTNLVEPSAPLASPYGLAMPTGYRVAVVPGAVEVSARLVSPEEIRNLMKVLRAGIVALEDTTDGDMDAPLNLDAPLNSQPQVAARIRAAIAK